MLLCNNNKILNLKLKGLWINFQRSNDKNKKVILPKKCPHQVQTGFETVPTFPYQIQGSIIQWNTEKFMSMSLQCLTRETKSARDVPKMQASLFRLGLDDEVLATDRVHHNRRPCSARPSLELLISFFKPFLAWNSFRGGTWLPN